LSNSPCLDDISINNAILTSDIDELSDLNLCPATQNYHTSVSGSILYSVPSKLSSEIFSYLRHGDFDGFRRSLDLHHHEIIKMRNDHEQVNISVKAFDRSWNATPIDMLIFFFFQSSLDCITCSCHTCIFLRMDTTVNDARL
jgi:hypothetical protein